MASSRLSSLPCPPKSNHRVRILSRAGPAIPSITADGKRRFTPPSSSSSPIDLFEVGINACSCPDYRFVSRTDPSQMFMFIDGASSNNGAPHARAGCGVVFAPSTRHPGISHRLELDSYPQSSGRAELRAAILALGLRNWFGEGYSSVVLATDSEYVVGGACAWILKWRINGWITSQGKEIANKDLWELLGVRMRELEEYGTQVMFWKIPRAWNEADALAKAATDLETSSTELTQVHVVGGYDGIPEGVDAIFTSEYVRNVEAGETNFPVNPRVVMDFDKFR